MRNLARLLRVRQPRHPASPHADALRGSLIAVPADRRSTATPPPWLVTSVACSSGGTGDRHNPRLSVPLAIDPACPRPISHRSHLVPRYVCRHARRTPASFHRSFVFPCPRWMPLRFQILSAVHRYGDAGLQRGSIMRRYDSAGPTERLSHATPVREIVVTAFRQTHAVDAGTEQPAPGARPGRPAVRFPVRKPSCRPLYPLRGRYRAALSPRTTFLTGYFPHCASFPASPAPTPSRTAAPPTPFFHATACEAFPMLMVRYSPDATLWFPRLLLSPRAPCPGFPFGRSPPRHDSRFSISRRAGGAL